MNNHSSNYFQKLFMDKFMILMKNKIVDWLIFSTLVLLSLISGYFTSVNSFSNSMLFLGLFLLTAFFQCFLIFNIKKEILLFRKKILNTLFNLLNIFFAYIIGFSIPLMESLSKFNFALVMAPMLIVLSIILVNKIKLDSSNEFIDKGNSLEKKAVIDSKKPIIIEYENKKYIFSIRSLIILAIGSPILAYLIYLFFDTPYNFWLHEIVVKQTVFFLNLFFNMGASANYNPIGKYYWSFSIPGKTSIFFETFCTGIQAICVFAGIIICTPHSKDLRTSRDIIWRKTKSLIVSSVIFYIVNIIRMLIQIYLYYIGYPWESIHVSISAASSFIAAIIILLLHKWIPEFIISIIYAGTIISKKFKKSK